MTKGAVALDHPENRADKSCAKKPSVNRVDVEIDEVATASSGSEVDLVRNAVQVILKREGYSADDFAHVTVLLTGDARIKKLNRDFAGENYVTDVLSFGIEADEGFPDPEVEESHQVRLGDIAISVPQTKRQADEKGVTFERELAMLAIHGALHLMGYDHAEPEEERVMFGKTDDALDELFLTP